MIMRSGGEYEKEFDWEDYSKETCMTSLDEDEDWYEPPQEPYEDPYPGVYYDDYDY